MKEMAVEAYVSQQKIQLLDSLENQVRFSQLVAVVTGDKGIGKSFLVKQLQNRIENEALIVAIDASLDMTEKQLEQAIIFLLGLSWQEPSENLEIRIQNELVQKVLITIDDAHLLSVDCLDYILQLNQNQLNLQEPVLFILLAGDISLPNIISELKTFEQHRESCVVFQINPIRQHETHAMLTSFSQDNSSLIEDLCDEKKINYFWQLSKGNPGELFYHLSRWFEENLPTEVVEISRDDKTSYLKSAMYVSIAAVLITALIFQDEINAWIGTNEKPAQTEKLRDDNEVINDNLSLTQKIIHKKEVTQDRSIEKQLLTNNEKQTNNIQAENKNQKDQISVQPVVETFEEKQIPVKANLDKVKSSNKKIELPETPQPKIEEKPTLTKANTLETANLLTKEEASLLLQDDKLFVLQWVGVSQLQAANSYKQNHTLGNKMIVYRRPNGKKRLYLVISGQFLNRLQAEVTKAEYKKRGYKGDPWVKSMQAVKKEIKSFQELF